MLISNCVEPQVADQGVQGNWEKELERCGLGTGTCGEGTGDRGLGTGNWGQ